MEELIVVGSGTGIPSLKRASPGLLLISESSKTLIDSGPGTLWKMLEAKTTYNDIDLMLYTHIHPDHTADLIPFLFACKYANQPRQKDLLCMGGPGFNDYFQKLKTIYGRWIEPQSYPLTVRDVSENTFVFRDLTLTSRSVAHLPGSVGYRIDLKSGKSIAFSGDTDYCQNIVNLGFEADLLILECSFPDGQKVEGHLTPSLAGRIGMESHCKRLLLTHLYPECDHVDILGQCRKIYTGEILIADDLLRIRI
jgi:ribonuclease BN (tRNA processing enzyme)